MKFVLVVHSWACICILAQTARVNAHLRGVPDMQLKEVDDIIQAEVASQVLPKLPIEPVLPIKPKIPIVIVESPAPVETVCCRFRSIIALLICLDKVINGFTFIDMRFNE